MPRSLRFLHVLCTFSLRPSRPHHAFTMLSARSNCVYIIFLCTALYSAYYVHHVPLGSYYARATLAPFLVRPFVCSHYDQADRTTRLPRFQHVLTASILFLCTALYSACFKSLLSFMHCLVSRSFYTERPCLYLAHSHNKICKTTISLKKREVGDGRLSQPTIMEFVNALSQFVFG